MILKVLGATDTRILVAARSRDHAPCTCVRYSTYTPCTYVEDTICDEGAIIYSHVMLLNIVLRRDAHLRLSEMLGEAE